jgi:deoxyribodipyrimidine photolyase-related protein
MHVNRTFFLKNPRLGMLVRTYDKMTEEKKQTLQKNAEDFLRGLDLENEQASLS